MIMDDKGRVGETLLFDNEGKDLERNQWYNLIMTNEQHLVVITKRKQ